MKTVGGFRRSRYRGVDLDTGLYGELVATAYLPGEDVDVLIAEEEAKAPVVA